MTNIDLSKTELRLEIGNGSYYQILGQPDISDNLGNHGATATVQVRVQRNAPLPRKGELAFITRLESSGYVKIFGGRCGQPTPKLNIYGDDISLTLDSFVNYTQRVDITNYKYTDTLASHLTRACTLAKVINNSDVLRQWCALFVRFNPDDNEPFPFSFQKGKLEQFLDEICAVSNCNWSVEDTGALSIATLGLANSNLIVRSNAFINTPAPKSQLTIPEPGAAICPVGVFWTPGLTYTPIPPIASVIRVFGRNGKNIYGSTTLLNPDILRYRAENGRDNYPISQTADEVLLIKITLPNMTTFYLDKQAFNPDEPTPPDGSFEARIRPEEHSFYCSPVDVPANSLIEVYHKTNFVYYELVNNQAKAIFVQIDLAGHGLVYYDIDNPDITDMPTAIKAAEQAEAIVCALNFSINFGVNANTNAALKGWKSGQQFTVVHTSRDIRYLVTIQEVRRKLLLGRRDFYQIQAATIQMYKPDSLTDMLINKVNNPPSERLVGFTVGTGV